MARQARQRAEWQGFAGPARPGWSGSAQQAWCGRRGRNSQGLARQAWPGQVGTAKPGGRGRHGLEGLGEIWTGRAWQAWLRRHGLARPVLAGKAWSSVEGQVRLARCGRARARHGWQGLGVYGLGGMAGEVTRAWLGLVWRALQASLGTEGQARLAGVERVALNGGVGRHGVTRPGAIEEPQGLAGMVRKAGIGRQGKAWPGQAWLAREAWRDTGWRGKQGVAG